MKWVTSLPNNEKTGKSQFDLKKSIDPTQLRLFNLPLKKSVVPNSKIGGHW